MKGNNKIKDTQVTVKLPENINIELVQANEIKHYELFQWLTNIFLPIAVGFWTANFTFTSSDNRVLFWSAIIFTAVSGLFIVLSFVYRRKVYNSSVTKVASLNNFN